MQRLAPKRGWPADGRVWDSERGPGLQDVNLTAQLLRKRAPAQKFAASVPSEGAPRAVGAGRVAGSQGTRSAPGQAAAGVSAHQPCPGGARLICFTGNSIRTAGEGPLMSMQKTLDHIEPTHDPSILHQWFSEELLPPRPPLPAPVPTRRILWKCPRHFWLSRLRGQYCP